MVRYTLHINVHDTTVAIPVGHLRLDDATADALPRVGEHFANLGDLLLRSGRAVVQGVEHEIDHVTGEAATFVVARFDGDVGNLGTTAQEKGAELHEATSGTRWTFMGPGVPAN